MALPRQPLIHRGFRAALLVVAEPSHARNPLLWPTFSQSTIPAPAEFTEFTITENAVFRGQIDPIASPLDPRPGFLNPTQPTAILNPTWALTLPRYKARTVNHATRRDPDLLSSVASRLIQTRVWIIAKTKKWLRRKRTYEQHREVPPFA